MGNLSCDVRSKDADTSVRLELPRVYAGFNDRYAQNLMHKGKGSVVPESWVVFTIQKFAHFN